MVFLQGVLRLKPGALLCMGTPCSAHVWMCSSTTKKTQQCPRGDASVKAVRTGNMTAARSALGCLVAMARRVWWLIEQPGSSVLPYMTEMQWVFNVAPRVIPDMFPRSYMARLLLARNSVCLVGFCYFLKFILYNNLILNLLSPTTHVFDQLSWMGKFGAKTVKRSILYGTVLLYCTAVYIYNNIIP